MKANHYAKKKPTVVLYVPDGDMDKAQALMDDDTGKPAVFPNFAKAAKHVSRFIDPKIAMDIQYVNETPVRGAGDREDTDHKRCLKCNGFLRLDPNQSVSRLPDGSVLALDRVVCPVCDLGEKPM